MNRPKITEDRLSIEVLDAAWLAATGDTTGALDLEVVARGEIEPEALIFHTDRSRMVTTRRCARARFWGYEVELVDGVEGVGGVVPTRTSIPMLIGSAVHQGLEVLHRAVMDGVELDALVRDYSVKLALDYYNGQVLLEENQLEAEMDLAQDEWLEVAPGSEERSKTRDWEIKEGRALVEALVRAYWMTGLGQLVETYEILTVEEEVSTPLLQGGDFIINMNGRKDALLRDKLTGGLFALSIKTAKDLDARAASNWREDDQGISECVLIRQMIEDGKLEKHGIFPGDEVQIGVQMLHLLKGGKYKDQNDGIWKHSSPLVRPFTQEGPMGDLEFRPKWNWVDDTGKNRTLGKGWRATPIWETGREIQDWLEELFTNHEGVLEGLVVLSEPLVRSHEEMRDWVLEAGLREYEILAAKQMMQEAEEFVAKGGNPAEGLDLAVLMAGKFPKNRSACNYPTACEFKVLCHPVSGQYGMSELGHRLWSGGLVQITGAGFKQRVPNHPQEGEK